MTYEPSHSAEHMPPPPAQAEEGIGFLKVIAVGLGSLAVFALATWITFHYMKAREKDLQPLGPDPIPMQIGESEIGIVDQSPYDVTRALQAYRKDKLDRLQSWGWIDRKRGAVHMPIDRAMDLTVEELRK